MHLTRGRFAEIDFPKGDPRRLASLPITRTLDRLGLALMRRVDPDAQTTGRCRTSEAETMIGLTRLNNIQQCVTDVIRSNIPGDLVEAGVWRGGAAIFLRALLEVYSDAARKVWVADSFQGLPKPDPDRYPADRGDTLWKIGALAVSLEEVKANFARYGLLDDRVQFLQGFFSETLPAAPIERISVLRLDCDMYESTMTVLDALYDRVSRGGYVIIDDFGAIAACRQAVSDFRSKSNINDEIHAIDWTGVYWQRSS